MNIMYHDQFKNNHEGLAAREFLPRYNAFHTKNFVLINKTPKAEPDFHSIDIKSNEMLNFDVTLGATRQMIIEWRKLLRKEYRKPGPGLKVNLRDDFNVCRDNIVKKFSKRYGKNCALVLYHFNPFLYATDFVNDLRHSINFTLSPFDKGVWLISTAEFYRIDDGIR